MSRSVKPEEDYILRRAALKAGKIIDKGAIMSDTMRDAAWREASDLYASEDTYNYPKDAMAKAFERGATWQAAQSQPAPPVPATVQEIMRLMNIYVRSCIKASVNVVTGMAQKDDEAQFDAAFKPHEAALTALVNENHRLKFELDGVRAMRGPLTKYCWLVEHRSTIPAQPIPAKYHTEFSALDNGLSTSDPYKATRYATKAEAQQVVDRLGSTFTGAWEAVEHCFEPPPTHGIEPEQGGNHGGS